jgi:hypothetical protein
VSHKLNKSNILGNIGGNMGMFVGMSLLSCTEVLIFFSKISWILFSKKRRNYLKQKKDQEKVILISKSSKIYQFFLQEREQRLDETLKNIKLEAEKAATVYLYFVQKSKLYFFIGK